jgi:hypothetical protein
MRDDSGPGPFDADAGGRDSVLRNLRIDIGLLDKDSDDAAVAKIVARIAVAELDVLQVDRLLNTIKRQTGTSLQTLRRQLTAEKVRTRTVVHNPEEIMPRIGQLNRDYAVVNETGKAWVVRWRDDPVLGRQVLERISFQNFRNLFLNEKVNGTTIAGLWLEHTRRRQYLDGIVFDPTGKAPASCFNLWRGFAAEPAPGDWSLLRGHIEKVICAGDADNFAYVLDWLARLVQHPQLPGEVALVMTGGKGVGKGILGRWIYRAVGQHGMQITNPEHLVGKHNAHLRDCIVLFADEAFYAGDRRHEGILKGLVTEPVIMIEPKYVDAIQVPNRLHVIMASNDAWVVPASSDERRYFVLAVSDARRGDHPYFAAIEAQMQAAGLAAMLHELLDRDISAFQVRSVPQTEALRSQKTLSLNSVENWWKTVLDRGFLYKSRHGTPWFDAWHDFYSNSLLYESYAQLCKDANIYRRASQVEVGRFMGKLYSRKRPDGRHPSGEIDNYDRELVKAGKALDNVAIAWRDRPSGYFVEDLDHARRSFLENYDVDAEWTHLL